MKGKVKKLDFTGMNIYVGIDTHLKKWAVTIFIEDSIFKTFSMDPKAHLLHNYLRNNFPNGNYFSVYEAGFCGYSIHRELIDLGIKNIIVNPADIPTTNKETVQKEDARDSRKLARSLSIGELEAIYIPKRSTEELRGFVRHRKTIVKDISRNKARIKSFLYRHGIGIPIELSQSALYWSSNFTKWLKTIKLTTDYGHVELNNILENVNYLRLTLLSINRKLREIAKRDEYKQQIKYLTSIPGIGLIVAMTIISELESILRFKNLDRLCSFIGLVPSTNSSGQNERVCNITPRCNQALREVIIESAWIAKRNDPALAFAFSKLCKRMKPNRAIIRIAKKLLNRIRFVLINQEEYEYAIM
jgi:transposase